MLDKEFLANQIYGNDAEEVLNFLAKVAPDKHEFRNEKTFFNFIARELQPMLKKMARKDKEKQEFWTNRAISMDITFPINKKKNVLWCIRLLSESL